MLQGEVAWKSMNDARFGDLVRQYAARNNAEDAWKAQSEARLKAGEDFQVAPSAGIPLLLPLPLLCGEHSCLCCGGRQREQPGLACHVLRGTAAVLGPAASRSLQLLEDPLCPACMPAVVLLSPATAATTLQAKPPAREKLSLFGRQVAMYPFPAPLNRAISRVCCGALCSLARMPLRPSLLPR
jgi:hypothetical protein